MELLEDLLGVIQVWPVVSSLMTISWRLSLHFSKEICGSLSVCCCIIPVDIFLGFF